MVLLIILYHFSMHIDHTFELSRAEQLDRNLIWTCKLVMMPQAYGMIQ